MLITPDIIESECLRVLRRRHVEHLAGLERQLGLPARTIEPLATIDLLTDDENRAFKELPAVLLVVPRAPEPDRTTDGEREVLRYSWELELQIIALGGGAGGRQDVDVMRRVRWYWATVTECLMQRLPRRCDPVETLTPGTVDFEVIQPGRALGRCETKFTVVTVDTITTIGGLHVDLPGSDLPEDPYAPPAPPPVATDLDVGIERDLLEPSQYGDTYDIDY